MKASQLWLMNLQQQLQRFQEAFSSILRQGRTAWAMQMSTANMSISRQHRYTLQRAAKEIERCHISGCYATLHPLAIALLPSAIQQHRGRHHQHHHRHGQTHTNRFVTNKHPWRRGRDLTSLLKNDLYVGIIWGVCTSSSRHFFISPSCVDHQLTSCFR